MAEDNWSDRSTFECSTCMWFIGKGGGLLTADRRVQTDATPTDVREAQAIAGKGPVNSVRVQTRVLGRCRRHAPVSGGHGWPAVYTSDWCGDHKVRA